ncbi:MAG: hypothetical protein GMKNLPBB_02869 [Myxococcota bacterium]|nr:hypothetical protein [Myxococcota bacterium]
MNEELKSLVELQKLDVQAYELRAQVEKQKKSLTGASSRQKEAQAALDDLVREHAGKQAFLHQLEARHAEEQDKARKWEKRLNDLKKSAEFAALQRELDGVRITMEEISAEMKATRERLEEIVPEIEAARARLEEAGQAVSTEQSGLDQGVRDLEIKLAAFTAGSEALRKKVSQEMLRNYDFIRTRIKGGVAIVPLVNKRCAGCSMNISPLLYNRVVKGATTERCPSCQRFIYLPEDAPPA